MSIMKWVVGLLGMQVSGLDTTISAQEANKIIDIINAARRDVEPRPTAMMKVEWDYPLQDALDKYANLINKKWFFEKNQNWSRYNGEALMRMAPFNTSFVGYDHFIHDGCQSSADGVSKIVYDRAVMQRHCFNYNVCNDSAPINPKGTINGYESCNNIPSALSSQHPCSWWWQYYPMIVYENVTKLACVMTGVPTPSNPNKLRDDSFFCYYSKAAAQTTAKPYRKVSAGHAVCSECPPKSQCKKLLCV